MVTAIDALTFVSGKWETREGRAGRGGQDGEGDPGPFFCHSRRVS